MVSADEDSHNNFKLILLKKNTKTITADQDI